MKGNQSSQKFAVKGWRQLELDCVFDKILCPSGPRGFRQVREMEVQRNHGRAKANRARYRYIGALTQNEL